MSGTPVWEHLPSGKRRARVLKRPHVCTEKCLVITKSLGLWFASCKRFSYRPPR